MVSASKLTLIPGLAVFSAIIVYTYNGALSFGSSAAAAGLAVASPFERPAKRRLEGRIKELDMDVDDYMNQRVS